MRSCAGCHPDITCVELRFDHGKGSLHQGSRPADCLVSALLLEGEWVISDGAVHGLVHGCSGLHAEITLVPVDRFSFLREIDLVVMEGGSCRFDPSDELMVFVQENVDFVSDIRF